MRAWLQQFLKFASLLWRQLLAYAFANFGEFLPGLRGDLLAQLFHPLVTVAQDLLDARVLRPGEFEFLLHATQEVDPRGHPRRTLFRLKTFDGQTARDN